MVSLNYELRSASLSVLVILRADSFSCSTVVRYSFLMCFNVKNDLSPGKFVAIRLKNCLSIVSSFLDANRMSSLIVTE
jgi:hypothetical protein